MTRKSPKSEGRGKRKPHNAKTITYISFDDLLRQIALAPRSATIGDAEVTMSREERLYRLMIDGALKGEVHDVLFLLKKMAENPTVAAAYREEIVMVISGPLAAV